MRRSLVRVALAGSRELLSVCTALGLDYPCESPIAKAPRPVASYVLNTAEEGQLVGVDIAPEIRDYLFEQKLFVQPGSPVLPFTRGDRALGILIFKFPDLTVMREKMDQIEDLVRVVVNATPA